MSRLPFATFSTAPRATRPTTINLVWRERFWNGLSLSTHQHSNGMGKVLLITSLTTGQHAEYGVHQTLSGAYGNKSISVATVAL